jgi:hypothetical protein
MRWFYAAVLIAVLVAADRAYMRGENTALMMSAARSVSGAIARTVSQQVDDLMKYLRR